MADHIEVSDVELDADDVGGRRQHMPVVGHEELLLQETLRRGVHRDTQVFQMEVLGGCDT